jgi:hypothetical protein
VIKNSGRGSSETAASLITDMVETRSQRSRAAGHSEAECLDDALKSATTPWPVERWIKGRKDIMDDPQSMTNLREASIAIASLLHDVTSERISSAWQLGDWISMAKEHLVSSAARHFPLLVTFILA